MLSFDTSVSTASIEDLYRSTILWVEQQCSLVRLRPGLYKIPSCNVHTAIVFCSQECLETIKDKVAWLQIRSKTMDKKFDLQMLLFS